MDHWFWKYAYENKGCLYSRWYSNSFGKSICIVIGFFVMVVYDRIIPSNA